MIKTSNYNEMKNLAITGLSSAKQIAKCINKLKTMCGTGFVLAEADDHIAKLTTLFYDLTTGFKETKKMTKKKKKLKKDGKLKKRGITKHVIGKITSVGTDEKTV